MTFKDNKTDNPNGIPTSKVRILQFTCPDCGSNELFEAWPDYVHRQFIQAVACQPLDSEETAGEVSDARIIYRTLADGSMDEDYEEDNYDRSRYTGITFFACANCDEVLRFENGSEIQDKHELAEWLIRNQEQRESHKDQSEYFRCPECGNDRFFLRQDTEKSAEEDTTDNNLHYRCSDCGWMSKE